jgi:hypothetical protein
LSDVKARGYLNQVRRRAFVILIMISQHQSSINRFYFDRKKNRAVGEGHRFFDLVRTKKGGSRNNWIYSW